MSFKYEETSAGVMLNDMQFNYTTFTEAFLRFKIEIEYCIRNGTFTPDKVYEFHDIYIPAETKCDSCVEFFRSNMPYMTDKETGRYACLRDMYESFRRKVFKEIFIILTNSTNPTKMMELLKN